MSFAGDFYKKAKAGYAADQQAPFTEAAAYQKALERAAYGDAGDQYSQGLGDISRYLSGAGPLADSGAATALRARLASQIYGAANKNILGGYANYLGSALQGRRAFLYQLALLKAQRKMQQTGVGGVLGGIAGSVGGPFLGAIGKGLGEQVLG